MHLRWHVATITVLCLAACSSAETGRWSEDEKTKILRLELRSSQAPADTTNTFADDDAAAAFGQRLFFDQGLSASGKVACATCHSPEKDFTDGRAVATVDEVLFGRRNTPSVVGRAFSAWLFWDGRKDSLWAQALGPFENPIEHDFTRMEVVRRVSTVHRTDYEQVFGAMPLDMMDDALPQRAKPDPEGIETESGRAWAALPSETRSQINRAFSNVGKAIAAYERRLAPRPAPFDRYAASLREGREDPSLLSTEALDGLKLFVGKANCVACHDGSMLSDNGFHNLGVPPRADEVSSDVGRRSGARSVLQDEFNCAGPYSDSTNACRELKYLDPSFPDFDGAFRTPSLRGVSKTAPYMHAGQFATLREVLSFYNTLPGQPQLGHRELTLKPLQLSETELAALIAFLESLTGDALSS
jgi:cytochrome c peroxidase